MTQNQPIELPSLLEIDLQEKHRLQTIEALEFTFRRTDCYKLIEYQGTLWKIAASTDVGRIVTVDLKEITRQLHEVTSATNYAKILDGYQFYLCKEMEKWSNDVEYVKSLRDYRLLIMGNLVLLAAVELF